MFIALSPLTLGGTHSKESDKLLSRVLQDPLCLVVVVQMLPSGLVLPPCLALPPATRQTHIGHGLAQLMLSVPLELANRLLFES